MKFRRTFKVETVQNMGSDEMIARAARNEQEGTFKSDRGNRGS